MINIKCSTHENGFFKVSPHHTNTLHYPNICNYSHGSPMSPHSIVYYGMLRHPGAPIYLASHHGFNIALTRSGRLLDCGKEPWALIGLLIRCVSEHSLGEPYILDLPISSPFYLIPLSSISPWMPCLELQSRVFLKAGR